MKTLLILAFSLAVLPAWADEAPPTTPRSFGDAYSVILERSLRILTQRAEVRASEERKLGQIGNFLPTLTLNWSDQRTGPPYTGAAEGTVLSTNVNLFRSGGDVAGLRAASAELRSNREKLLAERQGAEEDAIESLVGYIGRVRQRMLEEQIVSLRTESLRIAKQRYDKGLLAQQEVDKVDVDLENSRSSLIDSQTLEASARAGLVALLGDDKVQVEWPWKEAILQGSKLELQDFKLDARPDWRSLSATSDQQRYKQNQALGTLLPSLDLSAGIGADPTGNEPGNWRTILVLTVPLFNGFKDYAAYQVQGVMDLESRYQLESLRRSAPADVDGFKSSFKAARESVISRERTAKISQSLYADNLKRFQMGRATANELAFDQDRFLQAQLHEVDGWSNAHLTYSKLCHGLGHSVLPSGKCELP